MIRRTSLLALACTACGLVAAAPAPAAKPAPPQAATLDENIPIGTDGAGRAWSLGGFSALAPLGASGKEFWTVTDRGPNDDADRAVSGVGVHCATKPSGKVIFLPAFNPEIAKLGVNNGSIHVQERVPLHDGANAASGKPNLTFDENTYLQTDPTTRTCTPIANSGGVIDPFGVDTEGIAVDPRDGSFWLADEYRPSLIHVASDGQIIARLVPGDLTSPAINTATAYAASVAAAGGTFAVQPVLPSIINAFRKNRGFEGLAISPDGTKLYAVVQSPLDYAALGVSSANRNLARSSPYIRVLRVDISDIAAPVVDREWIYLLSRGFSSAVPDKISDVGWLGEDVLLIQERDDDRPTAITNHYRADFSGATNLLEPGAAADLAAKTTAPTLEMTSPVPASITPGTRTIEIDVDQLLADADFINSKVEGLAMVRERGANPALVAVLNDNDFDLDHQVLPALFPDSNPEQIDIFELP